MLVCTIGDLALDVVVRLGGPAAVGDDTPARTHVGAGGQAANVAAWAVALGARARWLGKRGSDPASQLAAGELERRGVELVGPEADGAGSVVVSLVSPEGERTMLSDPGVSPLLRAEEVDVRWLRGAAVLHVSGYALLRRPIDEAAARAAGAARAQGARVSVDLASAAAIEAYGLDAFRRRLELLAPDVLFANEAEADALGGDLPAPCAVVKRGAAGVLAHAGGERLELPAEPADAVDSTGAGDAFAAGFLLGGTLEEATRRGLAAAASCVATVGAMPPRESRLPT